MGWPMRETMLPVADPSGGGEQIQFPYRTLKDCYCWLEQVNRGAAAEVGYGLSWPWTNVWLWIVGPGERFPDESPQGTERFRPITSALGGSPAHWEAALCIRCGFALCRNVVVKTNLFEGLPITRTWGVFLERASWSPSGGGRRERDAAGASWDRRIALPPGRALASAACSSE